MRCVLVEVLADSLESNLYSESWRVAVSADGYAGEGDGGEAKTVSFCQGRGIGPFQQFLRFQAWGASKVRADGVYDVFHPLVGKPEGGCAHCLTDGAAVECKASLLQLTSSRRVVDGRVNAASD